MKEESFYWGVPIVQTTTNACSIWYAERHPNHQHVWCWSGSESRSGIFGYFASGRRHPVWNIHPVTQLIFLKDASTQEQAEYFTLLESENKDDWQKAEEMAFAAFEKILEGE